jgi:hypothetical protein
MLNQHGLHQRLQRWPPYLNNSQSVVSVARKEHAAVRAVRNQISHPAFGPRTLVE